MAQHVIEGTWEEIKNHEAELAGRYVRLIFEPDLSAGIYQPERSEKTIERSKHTSALGKYAFVAGGSEEFAEEKHK